MSDLTHYLHQYSMYSLSSNSQYGKFLDKSQHIAIIRRYVVIISIFRAFLHPFVSSALIFDQPA